ncbi:hypothetical protein HNR78_001633 [Parageobacillus toebii NBRC 107807]|jgi:hypothetical protein|uniref:Uncharacterized protein n=1 Tax=Parageobacillus toebii NBRC 107807 TaxID=1223503 RepID=A0AA89NRB2_9BACL|nr:hypothetical protein [Parageobacillus toebii NBRC 107807]
MSHFDTLITNIGQLLTRKEKSRMDFASMKEDA